MKNLPVPARPSLPEHTGQPRARAQGEHERKTGGLSHLHPAPYSLCTTTCPVPSRQADKEPLMSIRYTVTIYKDYDGKVKVARTPR